MIQGYFGENGELFFEIELIATNGSIITVDAMLDTGFTNWLVMNTQDVESLGWTFIRKIEMISAKGAMLLNLYQGTIIFANQQLIIPVLGGDEISEILMGLPCLENRRLVVHRKIGLLTLE